MSWNLDSNRPIYPQIMERITMDIISGHISSRQQASLCAGTGSGGRGKSQYHAEIHCLNWNEQGFCTARGPAAALSRRI